MTRTRKGISREIFISIIGNIQSIPFYRYIGRRLFHNYNIREASKKDDLKKIKAWLFPETGSAPYLFSRNVTNLMALHKDIIVGFIQLVCPFPTYMSRPPSFKTKNFWLYSLVVRIKYRGLGIGESLTKQVIRIAREKGAGELYLLVNITSTPAIRLYEKLGFKRVLIPELKKQLLKEEKLSGKKRIVMKKTLRGQKTIDDPILIKRFSNKTNPSAL